MFLYRFNVLILKIIFKNKKLHFNAFMSENHFKTLPLSQSQTVPLKHHRYHNLKRFLKIVF